MSNPDQAWDKRIDYIFKKSHAWSNLRLVDWRRLNESLVTWRLHLCLDLRSPTHSFQPSVDESSVLRSNLWLEKTHEAVVGKSLVVESKTIWFARESQPKVGYHRRPLTVCSTSSQTLVYDLRLTNRRWNYYGQHQVQPKVGNKGLRLRRSWRIMKKSQDRWALRTKSMMKAALITSLLNGISWDSLWGLLFFQLLQTFGHIITSGRSWWSKTKEKLTPEGIQREDDS